VNGQYVGHGQIANVFRHSLTVCQVAQGRQMFRVSQ
jgi:hypothetical protein